ncbi:discoidin domain-containing protein [Akkermansiaceae bacterium]|nr:discoidin domain-containing protein [Akkermansiaceae bacterium]
MKRLPIKLLIAGLLYPWMIQPSLAGVVSATLNLVDEPNVNTLAISLAIPEFETGNDTTDLSGTVEATLQIDPVNGVVSQLTFTGGAISGTPITLAGNSTLLINPGGYSFNSNVLSGRINTIAPPGSVDNVPGAGDFSAARHELAINGGVLSGLLSSTFVNENVNQDFAANPVYAKGSGIGNVASNYRADLSNEQNSVYDIVVFLGVGSTTEVQAGAAAVTFGASGTIKLAGQVSVPYLPLIFNFSPNPQIVVDGDTTGLDYSVQNADSSSIDQGVGGLNPTNLGARTISPPAGSDTTYTFTAGNENGTVTRSTTVRSVAQGSATFRYVRFTPVRLKGDLPGIASADSIQIADFQFFEGSTERVPIEASNPGGANPGGEGPEKLIDGDADTKWLDFNKGCVIFDFGSAVTIDCYRFRTANDFLERDPVAWILEGSDGQAAWSIIEAITVRQDDYREDFNHFTPSARKAYTQRIPIPAMPAIPPPVITQFSSSPQILVNGETTNLGWDTTAATSLEIANFGSISGDSGSITVSPAADTDSEYTLTATNGAGREVDVTLLVRTVAQGSANFRFLRFTPAWLAEELPGFDDASSIQLAEFEFFNGVIQIAPVTVSNPGGNSPAGEGVSKVIDGDPGTKWLDFNKEGLVFDFGSQTNITAYRWTTANDEPSRDPVSWSLEGSNDGTNWSLVDNVTRNRANPSENVAVYAGLPRGATTPPIPVPDASSLLPVISQFIGDAPFLVSDEPLVLTWATSGAASVSIDQGIGPVMTNGSISVMPTFDTTYTMTATSPAGSVTEQFTTTVVTSTIGRICYEDFDLAGYELGLLGDARIVNDFADIPLPGDVNRLRLTPDSDGKFGSAWFRKRVDLSQGFQTWFDLQFMAANNSGADKLTFTIQNRPEGTGAEGNLRSEAFKIIFDSYLNSGDPSAGFIELVDGNQVLATIDLTVIDGIDLPGSVPNDLSSDDFEVAPYPVRVAYAPGDLDLFFQGVQVIDSLDVDLGATDALDEEGKAYVGFSACTGVFSEYHDITRWVLVEGPPAPPLKIMEFAVDLDTDTAIFTFSSTQFRTYTIEGSDDGLVFTKLATGIPGAAGTSETTTGPISFTETSQKMFRVVDEKSSP